jgi:hypothetical protein
LLYFLCQQIVITNAEIIYDRVSFNHVYIEDSVLKKVAVNDAMQVHVKISRTIFKYDCIFAQLTPQRTNRRAVDGSLQGRNRALGFGFIMVRDNGRRRRRTP